MDEWEIVSRPIPPNIVQVSGIETLGCTEFDLIHTGVVLHVQITI